MPETHPELRIDPLTGLRVIVAGERGARPGAFLDVTPREPIDPESDPFAAGNEDRTPPELYALREDGRDGEATHIVAVDDGVVIGTCRLLFRGQVARLGRLAVERERRGENVAAEILREADRIASEAGSESIALHAQTYALALYERAGYEQYGPTFVEEGIEHVAMEKRLA